MRYYKDWTAREHLDRVTDLQIPGTVIDWTWLLVYLARVLLGGKVLELHLAHLEKLYQARFERPALRFNHLEGDMKDDRVPPVNDRFAFHALLTDQQVEALLAEGPKALRQKELFSANAGVELLLNPYALWDLYDWVHIVLADYWLDCMTEASDELAVEIGLDPAEDRPLLLRVPTDGASQHSSQPFDVPAVGGSTRSVEGEAEEAEEELVSFRNPNTQQVGDNEWEVRLSEEAMSLLARKAYGDPTKPFKLILYRVPRGPQTTAEVEMRPAPVLEDVEIPFEFLMGEKRSFLVPVPEITRKDRNRPQRQQRSVPCSPIPHGSFPQTGWDVKLDGKNWFHVIVRSVLQYRPCWYFAL